MSEHPVTGPGFLAVSVGGAQRVVDARSAASAAIGASAVSVARTKTFEVATWGTDVDRLRPGQPLMLSRAPRQHETAVTTAQVAALLAADNGGQLARILPPFAALVQRSADEMIAAADVLGFRHLYFTEGTGWAGMSTSARALHACSGETLDQQAIAVQALLGWQLGQRTLFKGVQKLSPGCLIVLSRGRIEMQRYAPEVCGGGMDLDQSVHSAAKMLQQYLAAYLDDHPQASLQLTGGQDSRILLSAVPRARRSHLTAITLGSSNDPDVQIASQLAARFGMRHEVHAIDSLHDVSPEAAYAMCLEASAKLECMADPVALAALTLGEANFGQGPRLSGLGGEVARGFYYYGSPRSKQVTPRRSRRLARWRMFANESVPPDALDPAFGAWAATFALDEVHGLLQGTGLDWFSATDEFYLNQRMQRWAGVTDTAVCYDREVTNPMLDDRFIDIARRLHPSAKRNARFLGRLQIALDRELAAVPLDGRPPPEVYAQASLYSGTRQVATLAHKAVRKTHQRLVGANRPPLGGQVLAQKVTEHWMREPQALDPVRHLGVFREGWVSRVLSGELQPGESAVALMTNLILASS